MAPLTLALLIAMGVVFLVWVVLIARVLWMLTRRSLDRLDQTGGGFLRWTGHSLGSFGDFATSREDRSERRRIIAVTLLLIAIIIGHMVLRATGASLDTAV